MVLVQESVDDDRSPIDDFVNLRGAPVDVIERFLHDAIQEYGPGAPGAAGDPPQGAPAYDIGDADRLEEGTTLE